MKLLAYLQKPVNQEHDGGFDSWHKKAQKNVVTLPPSLTRFLCMASPILSRSERISERFFVPSTFLQPIRVKNTFESTNKSHEHISLNQSDSWTHFSQLNKVLREFLQPITVRSTFQQPIRVMGTFQQPIRVRSIFLQPFEPRVHYCNQS